MLWISKCYRYWLNSASHVCFLIYRFRWIGHIHAVVTRITSMNWLLLSLSLSVVVIYLCCCCWPVLTCPHTAQYLPSIYPVSTRYLHGIYTVDISTAHLPPPSSWLPPHQAELTHWPLSHYYPLCTQLCARTQIIMFYNAWLRTTPCKRLK